MKTLDKGIYMIPDGCICKRVDSNTIEIRDANSFRKTIGPEDRRCRNCIHRIIGFSIKPAYNRPLFKTNVCELKPKKADNIYYAVKDIDGKTCNNFSKK